MKVFWKVAIYILLLFVLLSVAREARCQIDFEKYLVHPAKWAAEVYYDPQIDCAGDKAMNVLVPVATGVAVMDFLTTSIALSRNDAAKESNPLFYVFNASGAKTWEINVAGVFVQWGINKANRWLYSKIRDKGPVTRTIFLIEYGALNIGARGYVVYNNGKIAGMW